MADQAEAEKKPFRFSLRTLHLFTTVVAVFVAILVATLSDRAAARLFVAILLSLPLSLLVLGMVRNLEGRRILRVFALGLLAIIVLGIMVSLLWPTV